MGPPVFVPKSRTVKQYLDEAAQYHLLTREDEAVLGRRLRGEASLDKIVSPETFLFARDYAAQAVAFCSDSRFAKAWCDYTSAYPSSGNGSLDEEVEMLRRMYRKDLVHFDGFVALTARYLLVLEDYARRVSPPLWQNAWKQQDSGFLALRKKRNPQIVLSFSDEVQQYAAEHPAVQKALYKAYQYMYGNAAAAQRMLVESNLRLVVSIAVHYNNRGVEFDDLIQFGNLGLIKSLEKFDSSRGFKFSTYATWWIRQSIVRGIQDTARPVRIPVHALETIGKLIKLEDEYFSLDKRPSFRDFVAARLEITPKKVDILLQQRRLLNPLIYLDAVASNDSETRIGDLINVTCAESRFSPTKPQAPDLSHDEADVRHEITALLGECLTPREEKVIRLRYGIGEPQSYSLEEVGAQFGLTRERIRQIEVKAMNKLRRHGAYLEDLL